MGRTIGGVSESVLGVRVANDVDTGRLQGDHVGGRRVGVELADDGQHPVGVTRGEMIEGLALAGPFQTSGSRIMP